MAGDILDVDRWSVLCRGCLRFATNKCKSGLGASVEMSIVLTSELALGAESTLLLLRLPTSLHMITRSHHFTSFSLERFVADSMHTFSTRHYSTPWYAYIDHGRCKQYYAAGGGGSSPKKSIYLPVF